MPKDYRAVLQPVWEGACKLPVAQGCARTLMFVSLNAGEGRPTIAAQFALLAARQGRRASWLVDLGFSANRQFKAFDQGRYQDGGRPGRAYDASLRVEPIFRVDPAIELDTASKLLTAHEVTGTNLMVTRFRQEYLETGQTVTAKTSSIWWDTLRNASDWIIADAPPLSTSPAAFKALTDMDAIILIVRAEQNSAADLQKVRYRLESRGAQILGIIMTGANVKAKRWV